jgi:hypothetical protein
MLKGVLAKRWYLLGQYTRLGWYGQAPDPTQALSYFEKAHKLGYPYAPLAMGDSYQILATQPHETLSESARTNITQEHYDRKQYARQSEKFYRKSLTLANDIDSTEIGSRSAVGLSKLYRNHSLGLYNSHMINDLLRSYHGDTHCWFVRERYAYIEEMISGKLLRFIPTNSLARNWWHALSLQGWRCGPELPQTVTASLMGRSVRVEIMKASNCDNSENTIIVVDDNCLPISGGEALMEAVCRWGATQYGEVIVLPARALIKEVEGEIYTAAWIAYTDGRVGVRSIGANSFGPEDVFASQEQIGQDHSQRSAGYWLSMYVNALMEGFTAPEVNFNKMGWIGVGGEWRMPFVETYGLKSFGFEPFTQDEVDQIQQSKQYRGKL